MASCEIVELEPQPAAVVAAKVPLGELPDFFGRAFHAVVQEAQRQGVSVVGAPFGYYPEPPGDLVTVAAGFPVSSEVTPTGDVTPLVLPGGRAVTVEHVGPYDTLGRTYGELEAWVRDHGLTPAAAMWESYLSDPDDVPPENWRTLVTQPLI